LLGIRSLTPQGIAYMRSHEIALTNDNHRSTAAGLAGSQIEYEPRTVPVVSSCAMKDGQLNLACSLFDVAKLQNSSSSLRQSDSTRA
jgi:hypothetical protein